MKMICPLQATVEILYFCMILSYRTVKQPQAKSLLHTEQSA